MVRIRLRRVGARHQASYRIVAADQRSPRDGRFLEILGHYNPRTEPATVGIDEGRLFRWLKNGAQPSESVRKILRPLGTWERWDRYKDGEDLEALLGEAEAAFTKVDPRTRRDDLVGLRSKKVKEEQPEAEVPAAEAEKSEAAPEEVQELPEVMDVTESEPGEGELGAESAEGESEGIEAEEPDLARAEADTKEKEDEESLPAEEALEQDDEETAEAEGSA